MNSLSEDILRYLLHYLDDKDQIQLIDSSSFYHKLKKVLRKVVLNEEQVVRCCEDFEYLNEILSLMQDPGRQLILVGSMTECNVSTFPFTKILELKGAPISFISQLLSLKNELEISTVEFPEILEVGDELSDLDSLVHLCELGCIKNLRIKKDFSEYCTVPYFANIERLTIAIHYNSIRPLLLPASYASHLQQLDLTHFSNLDVSNLDGIPVVIFGDCNIDRGLSCLQNIRRIEISGCTFSSEPDLSKAFTNCEEIILELIRDHLPITLDLSNWKKVKRLCLLSSEDSKIIWKNNHLPSSVQRCTLRGLFVREIVWSPYVHQLQEFTLGDNTIDSLAGLGLDQIPVVTLEGMNELTSLEGLGGRNRKVVIRHCEQIEDFSAVRSVDTVTIEFCPYFSDFNDVSDVRDLKVDVLIKAINLNCLGKKTQVLYLRMRNLNKDSYSTLSKIPHLTINSVGLEALKEFLATGEGILANETITIFTSGEESANSIRVLHQQYLAFDYHLSLKISERESLLGSKYYKATAKLIRFTPAK